MLINSDYKAVLNKEADILIKSASEDEKPYLFFLFMPTLNIYPVAFISPKKIKASIFGFTQFMLSGLKHICVNRR
jgi:hypothetical protein